jgi:hypothetical protein
VFNETFPASVLTGAIQVMSLIAKVRRRSSADVDYRSKKGNVIVIWFVFV